MVKQNGLQNMRKVQSKMNTGQGTSKHKYRLEEWIESSPGEKHLWVQVDEELTWPSPMQCHTEPPWAG